MSWRAALRNVRQPVQHSGRLQHRRHESRRRRERRRPSPARCAPARCARPSSTAAATAAAVAMSRSPAQRSPIAAVRNDLRDGPASERAAERRELGQRRQRRIAVLRPLGESEPGIEHHRLAPHPGRQRALEARAQAPRQLPRPPTRSSASRYMSRERPRACIRTSPAPERAATSASAASYLRPAHVVDDRGTFAKRHFRDRGL